MTARRTTRIAALGAGLLALGFFSAGPAGAADGAQAETTVNVGTADAINQTLDLVNQACADAGRVGDAATSALASDSGITVASRQAGTGLNLSVSLPALTTSLPALDSLPVLGSVAGQLDAQPLQISCTAAADGTGLGVSAAGVEALVQAIAPGVDVSTLLPSVDASASTASGSNAPAASAGATATGSVPIKAQGMAQSPSVRASASAPSTTASTTASATPASASGSLLAQTVGSPGALARTGAGVGVLGLLGTMLFGSGRLLSLGRKLLRVG